MKSEQVCWRDTGRAPFHEATAPTPRSHHADLILKTFHIPVPSQTSSRFQDRERAPIRPADSEIPLNILYMLQCHTGTSLLAKADASAGDSSDCVAATQE